MLFREEQVVYGGSFFSGNICLLQLEAMLVTESQNSELKRGKN